MRILVLGVGGMLGHKMFQLLRSRFADTTGTIVEPLAEMPAQFAHLFPHEKVIDRLDATEFGQLQGRLREMRPDIIVNCVGIVKQRLEAQSALPSITVNSLLPHKLVQMCSEWNGKVIHFSTDCVFTGKQGNYTEASNSDADDIYGRTKFLGEVAGTNALTLRTSIIGRELKHHQSLLEWFLGEHGASVRGFTRAIYSGVTTNHLSWLVAQIIERHPSLTGLYQVTSAPISKYDLLCMLRDAYQRRIDVVPDDSLVCDRSMNGDKLREAIGYQCPPWPELIADLVDDPIRY